MRNLKKSYHLSLDFSEKELPGFFFFFLIVELDQVQIRSKIKGISICFNTNMCIIQILGIVFMLMVTILTIYYTWYTIPWLLYWLHKVQLVETLVEPHLCSKM